MSCFNLMFIKNPKSNQKYFYTIKYMSAIFILIGASLIVAIGFLLAFIWSVKNGQYEDDYTPSVRMLFDNSYQKKSTENKTTNNN